MPLHRPKVQKHFMKDKWSLPYTLTIIKLLLYYTAGKIALTEIALILLGCVQITRHVDPQPCSIASSKINCATCKMHSKNNLKKTNDNKVFPNSMITKINTTKVNAVKLHIAKEKIKFYALFLKYRETPRTKML